MGFHRGRVEFLVGPRQAAEASLSSLRCSTSGDWAGVFCLPHPASFSCLAYFFASIFNSTRVSAPVLVWVFSLVLRDVNTSVVLVTVRAWASFSFQRNLSGRAVLQVSHTMSDSDNERKRKAGEIDTTAVAPKKKLAAQAALAAAEAAEKDNAGAAKAGGSASSVAVKSENGKPSWSIEVTAPSGANAADSEEVLKFQNERMYAALEVR